MRFMHLRTFRGRYPRNPSRFVKPGVARYISPMTPELSPEEREALVAHLREHIASHRYPFSPTLRPLKSALAKLSPPEPSPTPYPPVVNKYPTPASKKKRAPKRPFSSV